MAFSFGKVIDSLIAFRIVKILWQNWTEMDAYKLGIIDAEGNFLKKTRELRTPEEKKAFTKFHVIMFRLKKIIEKIPFGKTKLGSLAMALTLLKEETNTQNSKLVETIVWSYIKDVESPQTINNLCEQAEMDESIAIGSCTLKEETITVDGTLLEAGTTIEVVSDIPVGEIFGVKLYGAVADNGETLFVDKGSINQC